MFCGINRDTWQVAVQDCTRWRGLINFGTVTYENRRISKTTQKARPENKASQKEMSQSKAIQKARPESKAKQKKSPCRKQGRTESTARPYRKQGPIESKPRPYGVTGELRRKFLSFPSDHFQFSPPPHQTMQKSLLLFFFFFFFLKSVLKTHRILNRIRLTEGDSRKHTCSPCSLSISLEFD